MESFPQVLCLPGTTYSTAEEFVQPVLQFDDKSELWRLVQDYTLEWGPKNFRKRLFMKAGFEYDKASVPRLFWGIARPDGPWEAAALFHDRLYRDKGRFTTDEFEFETQVNGLWHSDSSRWTRRDADNLLEMVGILGGASPSQARIYKAAVQVYPPNWFKGF